MAELNLDDLRNSVAYLSQKDAPRGDLLQALNYLTQLLPESCPEHMAMAETLVEEGFVYGLVLVLHEFREDDEILTVATRILYIIGSVEQFILSMVEYDAPGRIIFTLSQHMNCVALLQDGISLLGNMATNDHVKALIRMQQGIALLIDVIRNYPENIVILTHCCYALAVICVQSVENVADVVNGGGIPLIMPGLGLALESIGDPASAKLLEVGLNLLLNVSSNEPACTQIVKSGGGNVLAKLLHSNAILQQPIFLQLLLQCLANMCLHAEVSAGLVQKTSMMQGIVGVINAHSQNPDILASAVSVLCNIGAVSVGDKLVQVCRAGVIPHLTKISSAQPNMKALQISILEAISNMVGHSDSMPPADKSELANSCLPVIHSVLKFCLQTINENCIEVVLRILARLSADEKFGKDLVENKIITDIADILKRHYPAVAQASINSELVRGLFNCLADVANEDVTTSFIEVGVLNLCEAFIQSIVKSSHHSGDKVTTSPGGEKLALSVMRLLVNMATSAFASKNISNLIVPEILHALSSESGISQSQPFLQLVASFFINLGLQSNAISALLAHRIPEAIIEICQANAAFPDLVARFIMALNNIAITGRSKVKKMLKELNIHTLIRASNQAVQKAMLQFNNSLIAPDDAERKALVAKKRKEDEMMIRQQFSTGDAEARLIARFNIPVLSQELRTFVNAGKFMMKYGEFQNPHLRYVFVSPDLRFLVWRDTTGAELKSIYLLNAKEILVGAATIELQRTPCWGRRANDSCSFVVVGALRRACFECETVEERNKWVEALRAVIDYNIKVNAMEGKVEEEKPIDEDDEDFL